LIYFFHFELRIKVGGDIIIMLSYISHIR